MIQINENTILKLISLDVVSDIFTTIDCEREYLREWLPFVDATINEDDTKHFVASVLESDGIVYTIHQNDELVGLIGFNNLDTLNKKTEIGYWLREKYQGRGIITQSVLKLLDKAFNELGLNSVRINAAVDNLKSRRIPERLGFIQEGIVRDGELLVDNKFTDIVVYSILKKEFK